MKTNVKTHIVVAEAGWVYVGQIEISGGFVSISNASNIRVWGTTAGLGQLALNGKQKDTVLDYYGFVRIPRRAVMGIIDCKPGMME